MANEMKVQTVERSEAPVIPLFSGAARAASLFTRAMVLDQNERTWPDAERLYREVVRLAPGHWEAWNNLGVMAYQLGRRDDALDAWSRALDADPWCAQTFNNLGALWQSERKFEQAAVYFLRAVRIDGEMGEARVNLALCLQALGRFGAARRHWHKYLTRFPRGEWTAMAKKNERVCSEALDAAHGT